MQVLVEVEAVRIAKRRTVKCVEAEAVLLRHIKDINARPCKLLQLMYRVQQCIGTPVSPEQSIAYPEVDVTSSTALAAANDAIDAALARGEAVCVRLKDMRVATDEASAAEALTRLAVQKPTRIPLPLYWGGKKSSEKRQRRDAGTSSD